METRGEARIIRVPARPCAQEAHFPGVVEVVRSTVVSPNYQRLTLAGPCLEVPFEGGDMYFRLFLRPTGRDEMVLPTDPKQWWQEVLNIPEIIRPVVRTYTVRSARPGQSEIDVDVVRHGEPGPGTNWAAMAKPGDTVGILLQTRNHLPPANVDRQLLLGDETALPAIAAILEDLPPGMTVHVIAEVPTSDDVLDLSTSANLSITWLPRNRSGNRPGELALHALRNTSLPLDGAYAWIAGEAAMVRHARRHLRNQAIPRTHLYTCGYWRHGAPSY